MKKKSKSVVSEKSEADRIALNLNRDLEKCRRKVSKSLSKPKFKLNVGDPVSPVSANFTDPKVLEVLDDGLIYLIGHGSSVIFMTFLDVLPKGVESQESVIDGRKVPSMNFYNQDVHSLLQYHYFFGVDYEAPFQRGLVWNNSDKENLINSMFSSIEIGKFVFISKPRSESDTYLILDGKQRLSTLMSFYENEFSYNGKFFYELSTRDKNFFLHYPVSVAIGEHENWTLEDQYNYFLQLNVSGVPQSQEHLDSVKKKLSKLKSEKL